MAVAAQSRWPPRGIAPGPPRLPLGLAQLMNRKVALICVAVACVIFAGMVVSAVLRFRPRPAISSCVHNLDQLDRAKESWRLENHKITSDVPTWDDLLPYLHRKPVCPQGGTYTLGHVGEPPTCSIGGTHALPK